MKRTIPAFRSRERGAVLSRHKKEVVRYSKFMLIGVSLVLLLVGATIPGRAHADVEVVKYGMTGGTVKSVQDQLVTLGYLDQADGVFGSRTVEAVKKFQKDQDLTQDGVAGAKTQTKLLIATTPRMEKGSVGATVTSLQNALKNAGYSIGYVDGEFGDMTYNAVMQFQNDYGLTADGIVGKATIAKLYNMSTTKLSTGTTLRRGDRGADVEAMQRVLKAKGYMKDEKLDGVFGAATEQAVKSYQKDVGLSADGVAGKRTLSALNGEAYASDTALSKGEQLMNIARAQLGIPYVWAGSSPSGGFDCSGLIYYCYKQMGVSIPRGGGGQMVSGRSMGTSLSNAIPGDILCWPGHVGLYVGNNQFLHAPQTGDVVRIQEIRNQPADIRRIFD